MEHAGPIANATGVPASQIEKVLSGQVTNGLATEVGGGTENVQAFVDGTVETGVAGGNAIGMNYPALKELRDHLGKAGAIGFLLGLAKGRNEE